MRVNICDFTVNERKEIDILFSPHCEPLLQKKKKKPEKSVFWQLRLENGGKLVPISLVAYLV